MESKIKYFIYCRKSSEARDRQAISIESQHRELQEYATSHNLKIIEVFEESQSAYKLGRPIFKKMMDLCKEGIANGILTWKTDRLARNAEDGGRVIQNLDDKVLLEIRTPFEVYKHEDNRMMLYVLFGMNNDFSRQISANVKRGNRQKYARGEFLGGFAPVGYIRAKVGLSRNIAPDPAKAPLVKKAFEEYATGKYSVLQLWKIITDWGLTSVTGRKFVRSEVYRLLSSPVYYGVFKHGGEFHQGSYEPLISKELFDQVQAILHNRSKPRKQDWVHIYKGLLKCPECGCAITAETKVKNYKRTNRTASYTYYRCTKRRGKCSQPAVTEQELEKMLREYIGKISIDREVWELGIKLLKAKNAKEIELNIGRKEQLELESSRIERASSQLLTMRLNEEITADEYAANKKTLMDRKIGVKEKLEDREQNANNWLELAEGFFETAFNAREIMESDKNMAAKRELVRTVGWNLFLRDKKLEFSFKKPYDILLKPQIRRDVQGRRESNSQESLWRRPV
jgi:site-specific DNA recombinase